MNKLTPLSRLELKKIHGGDGDGTNNEPNDPPEPVAFQLPGRGDAR